MQNLKTPQIKAKDVLECIIKRKFEPKKSILENMKVDLLDRFKEYENNKEHLENINDYKGINEDQKEALLDCYKRKGYLENTVIKKSIKDIQDPQHREKCPYCRINTPNTIDHYIPKDDFPEFSFLPINLIPCCSICNEKKGTRWKDENGRFFLNYYFDKICEDKFLYVKLDYKKDDLKFTSSINYYLNTKNIKDNYNLDIIISHFDKLNLLDRYDKLIMEEISNIYTKVMINDYPIDNHRISIEMEYKTLKHVYGENYWKTVLYKSILDSNYIEDVYNSKS